MNTFSRLLTKFKKMLDGQWCWSKLGVKVKKLQEILCPACHLPKYVQKVFSVTLNWNSLFTHSHMGLPSPSIYDVLLM